MHNKDVNVTLSVKYICKLKRLQGLFFKAFLNIHFAKRYMSTLNNSPIWDKVFKNGASKICGRQPLKNEGVWSTLSICLIYLTMLMRAPILTKHYNNGKMSTLIIEKKTRKHLQRNSQTSE